MINGHSVLAVIPARGGSKGLPFKNIAHLNDKPLLQWTVEAARNSRYIDRLILSSEDREIIDTARHCGCEVPFVRPTELAMDDTPGIDPLLHALDNAGEPYDYVVVLQPTSPLRSSADIDGTLHRCIDANADFCVSVTATEKHPAWCFGITSSGTLIMDDGKIPQRRQDLEPAYALNGAVYAGRTSAVRENRGFLSPETLAYVMPRERSLDIDTAFDLALCEFMLNRHVTENQNADVA